MTGEATAGGVGAAPVAGSPVGGSPVGGLPVGGSAGRLARLKKRAEFLAAAGGARTGGRSVMLQGRPRGDDAPARVGFTVTKKVGNAVERNRTRRRLRAAVDRCAGAAAPGCDYVLVARRPAITMSFEALVAELAAGFDRLARPRGEVPSPRRRSGGGRATPDPTRETTS